ncbi:PREDICTED: transcription factor bHLH67-like [Camelina sativa]|uniref:Transcription factor bHLH67-like n=1 Tax=Camelina sativa TaxID=90675 RepID=A0ABM0WC97_CAMSA|nr:PREDICTED: transcription factor bHLH67-like [Camelina sativa]
MERFQGHINPCFSNRKADVKSLEVQGFAEVQSFAIKEEEESLQDTVPFLQMLQSEDPSSFFTIKEPNFLTLLSSLQTVKEPWELEHYPEFHSPVRFPISASSMEGTNQALSSQEIFLSQANMTLPSSTSSPPLTANSRRKRKTNNLLPQEMAREKRRRRKTKPSKNIEEIEHQRVNHIAVERNRRRQMNEHISSLRALLPPSYIQRGDQASIVGGAINYVKVLEQIIQSLETQKRRQQSSEGNASNHLSGISSNELWTTREDQSCIPKIEATVIQNHVSLKVECLKKQGQLLEGIVSLEKLRLTVLHLNITSSSHSSVSYSFQLKMEDDCELESADKITAAVHQIFDIPTI